MLIPAIDLQGGSVVQLVQGERLAIKDDDVFRWVRRFEKFPKVQVIDLDAAMGRGNLAIIRQIAGALTCAWAAACAIGTRPRSSERAKSSRVPRFSRTGGVAKALADAVGIDRVIAAVDSRAGHVVIHGWKTPLAITPVEAVRALEPYCAEFLYTHVDTEGLMGGTNREAILAVRNATSRRVSAAGGITTQAEIDDLDAQGVDAVVGMAVYTGKLILGG
jgi:phosphoribosylformimino-5-aminoimidazole carboxamide ribotide isomerase